MVILRTQFALAFLIFAHYYDFVSLITLIQLQLTNLLLLIPFATVSCSPPEVAITESLTLARKQFDVPLAARYKSWDFKVTTACAGKIWVLTINNFSAQNKSNFLHCMLEEGFQIYYAVAERWDTLRTVRELLSFCFSRGSVPIAQRLWYKALPNGLLINNNKTVLLAGQRQMRLVYHGVDAAHRPLQCSQKEAASLDQALPIQEEIALF